MRSIVKQAVRLAGRHRRLTTMLIVVGVLFGAVRAYEAWVGASLLIQSGGVTYVSMRQDAPWLPRAVRAGLRDEAVATAGDVSWEQVAPGFEVAEQPVLVDGVEVERIHLTRIDPALFEFSIHVAEGKDLAAWMRDLQPAAVINGSYYDDVGGPATPVRIDGELLGPATYEAEHGAFVFAGAEARVADLAVETWQQALENAHTAMVSYPLLVAPDGGNRAPRSRWLASRSFIAEDENGLIILGSAPEGYFSLYRLGEFLRASSLNLKSVLNLDGGPVACLGVSIGGFTRQTHGRVELQVDGADGPIRWIPASRDIHAIMPIVLAVFPRASEAVD